MMFRIERFMASAMSLVRIAPDAPTSAPATMRTVLSTTKPAIATAVPVKALSSEMTTGMSAPPIGRTIVTPTTSAAATIATRTRIASAGARNGVAAAALNARRTVPATASTAIATVRIRAPGKMIGLPGTIPISFPDAISEPENVTGPIRTSATTKRTM